MTSSCEANHNIISFLVHAQDAIDRCSQLAGRIAEPALPPPLPTRFTRRFLPLLLKSPRHLSARRMYCLEGRKSHRAKNVDMLGGIHMNLIDLITLKILWTHFPTDDCLLLVNIQSTTSKGRRNRGCSSITPSLLLYVVKIFS